MAERRDDELPDELRALVPWLATPDAPDLRAAVRGRLPDRRPLPRRAAAAAVAAVLLALAIAVVPPTRTSIANAGTALLRFAGVELDTAAPARTLPATPSPLPSAGPVALDEARRRARFPIGVPARLGPPASVEVADPDKTGAPRIVSLFYREGTVRLDEFDGELAPFFFKKIDVSGADWTAVDGQPALWIPAPHAVIYIDRSGVERVETARLAGATLIWQRAGVTYRLEGRLTVGQALTIARSTR